MALNLLILREKYRTKQRQEAFVLKKTQFIVLNPSATNAEQIFDKNV
jgi:hypothetical protein